MYRFQTRHESEAIKQRFWQFSLELWRHSFVQAGLLALQDDSGANINTLLFAAWLALEGRSFDTQTIANSGLSAWNAEMTLPLRCLRRNAKTGSTILYQCLKNAELAAEQHEQQLLAATFDLQTPANDQISLESLLRTNLSSYLQSLRAQDVSTALQHCEALIQQALTVTTTATLEPDSP